MGGNKQSNAHVLIGSSQPSRIEKRLNNMSMQLRTVYSGFTDAELRRDIVSLVTLVNL